MLSNRLVVAVAAVAALAGAAGAGAFLASRQHAAPDTAPAFESAPAAALPGPAPVETTEAVMEETAPPVAEAPAAPAAPEPAPRVAQREAPKPAPAPRRTVARRETTAPRPAPRSEPRRRDPEPIPTGPAREEASLPPDERWDSPAGSRAARASEPVVQPVDPLPSAPLFEELTVPADSVIGLQLATTVSSETAEIEDRVEARVSRDVRANGRVVIPAGSRVLGSVTLVERGGKMKTRARLGVRFHTLVLADGTHVPIQTETVYREGPSPADASAAKVGGGAIGGAILGAILGGGKGAAIGGAVGAAGGTAAVMAGDRRPAQFLEGSPLTVKVLAPVTVTVETN